MSKQRARRGTRRGLGSAVRPRIYRYGKNGRVEGVQARLKRTVGSGKSRETKSISKYFSFSRYKTKTVALAKAERWLQRHERWQPKATRKSGKPAGKRLLSLVRTRARGQGRKQAKAA